MKLLIVTGASSGIGRGLAVHFSKLDFKVIATARRAAKLEETRSLGIAERIIPVVSDVGTDTGRQAIIDKVKELGVKVDILIQNAGIIGEITDVSNITEESWLNSFNINVHAPLFLVQSLLKNDLLAKQSRIMHMGSGAAHSPLKGWPSYNVTKAAFLMLYRYLQVELEEKEIFVGSLKPGIVVSEMQDEIRLGSGEVFPAVANFIKFNDNKSEDIEPHAPTPGVLDTPENVAHYCEFLLTRLPGKQYSEKEWDIRKEEDNKQWLESL